MKSWRGSTGLPGVVEVGCGRDLEELGGLDRMRTGLTMSQLGGKCCQSWMAGWDEKLPPELSLTRAGAFPRWWGEPWAGAQQVHQPLGFLHQLTSAMSSLFSIPWG